VSANPRTLSNDPRACYHSRKELFALLAQMRTWADRGLRDTEISKAIHMLIRPKGEGRWVKR
jgi:hypothetical protein